MAKLYFRYGVMGSGKSDDLIRTDYNYKEKGMNTIAFKPRVDTREGTDKCIIKSRTGKALEGIWLDKKDNIVDIIIDAKKLKKIDVILVDESQFLTSKQVNELNEIAHLLDIPVMCYGLKNNFKAELFEGSSCLLALADDIQEIKSICWCGRKATQNARIVNGVLSRHGDEIQIGGNESYVALCSEHYILQTLKKDK